LRKSIRGSRVQWAASWLPTLRLGRELVDEDDLREAQADEQRPERLPRRVPRALLQRLVRAHLGLEGVARALEELRGLRGVQVRADDLHFGGPQLDLRLHPGEHHLDAAAGDAQRSDVQLAQIEAEVR